MPDPLARVNTLYDADHAAFRDTVRSYGSRVVEPALAAWEDAGIIDRSAYLAAGDAGLLGLDAPTVLGGGGVRDFRYKSIIAEELARIGANSLLSSISLHNDVILPYLIDDASREQQQKYIPGCCSGELIGAICMTEPGTGSDLRGIRTTARVDGDEWVLNGSKTFITSGIHCDFAMVVARTDDADRGGGLSLIVVDAGTAGFEKGRKLDKIGQRTQDTAELHFDEVRVPLSNLIGERGQAITMLTGHLPQERLTIAVTAIATATQAIRWALDFVADRNAFGKPLVDFQTVQFTLAELATELDVARAYVDTCMLALDEGRLTPVQAAKAKWWATEMQKRVVDRSLQLFGGYGYMLEYPIARSYIDSRVATIYGGTTEIMKHIIGRDLRSWARRASR
ncbi:acyl-CoA dehydrogenase family protein [Nocardia sp. NPDC005745]|uniref:acyl-CoA dehydrogenase family protein n=1 Tax=Nocardia sp. NPDC005745 TaxID=3157061 RepID=UPI0033E450D5